ncbi:MAG: hypothetical protein IPI18_00430 [Saprospiraceae bacterium]|nr:hypothetical protein [Saprospiraceae bacterium]
MIDCVVSCDDLICELTWANPARKSRAFPTNWMHFTIGYKGLIWNLQKDYATSVIHLEQAVILSPDDTMWKDLLLQAQYHQAKLFVRRVSQTRRRPQTVLIIAIISMK